MREGIKKCIIKHSLLAILRSTVDTLLSLGTNVNGARIDDSRTDLSMESVPIAFQNQIGIKMIRPSHLHE